MSISSMRIKYTSNFELKIILHRAGECPCRSFCVMQLQGLSLHACRLRTKNMIHIYERQKTFEYLTVCFITISEFVFFITSHIRGFVIYRVCLHFSTTLAAL